MLELGIIDSVGESIKIGQIE